MKRKILEFCILIVSTDKKSLYKMLNEDYFNDVGCTNSKYCCKVCSAFAYIEMEDTIRCRFCLFFVCVDCFKYITTCPQCGYHFFANIYSHELKPNDTLTFLVLFGNSTFRYMDAVHFNMQTLMEYWFYLLIKSANSPV